MEGDISPAEVLGVPPRAVQEEIRKAFRKLALRWHPDKHSGQEKENAEHEFKKILWAYETMTKQSRSSFAEFCDQWEMYGADWTQLYDLNEDPPDSLPEEYWEKIQELWDAENKLSESERLARCTVDVVDWHSIQCWQRQAMSMGGQLPCGQGQSPQPKVDTEINSRVAIWKGSLLQLNVDAVVNSADIFLANTRSGVLNRSLHRAAGEQLANECQLHGKSATGNVIVTRAYALPSKFVVHVCAPKTQRARYLSLCYTRALDEAVRNNVKTIAFPCLSVGAGFPLESATNVALGSIRGWLERHPNQIDLIVFGLFRTEECQTYQKWMPWYFPTLANAFLTAPDS